MKSKRRKAKKLNNHNKKKQTAAATRVVFVFLSIIRSIVSSHNEVICFRFEMTTLTLEHQVEHFKC